MSAEALCLAGDAALLSLAVAGALLSRRPFAGTLVYGGSLVVSALLLVVAIDALLFGARGEPLVLPLGLPWIGAHFRTDAMSAFFLVVVNLGATAASLYGLGYGRAEHDPERVLPFFPAFLAGMNLVLVADDAYAFLLSWEFMSLASWALVMAHHREGQNTRAGYVYLLMASFGTLALLLAFALLARPAGSYAFDAMRAAGPPPGVAGLAFLLALIGAGSKAGIVPLHVWLPLAHPAAPSHVSALMSGVMTKVAVYGFVRIVFDLAGPASWWWSVPVLTVGAGSALLGVIYALMQHDLKRLLAYHTVENIGIIYIGLGLALGFKVFGMPAAASLALTAGLLHVFNHSLFKSLLFFGAGAVLSATGERDMERLGGLIHTMPGTAFFFLVGCVAISALPPFNGFVSEWLTFQAILLSPALPSWVLKILAPAVGAMLALSAALAAACFCKAFGITFLGRPRTEAVSRAREADRLALAAMAILATLCLLVGVLPGLAIDALTQAAQIAVGAHMPTQSSIAWLSIAPVAESRSSYNGLLVFLFIALSASLAASFIHRFASAALRRAPAWDCGFPDPSPATQYSAVSFAQPIRRVFGSVAFVVEERIDMPRPGEMRPAHLDLKLSDRIWNVFYMPLILIVERAAVQFNRLQFLSIRQYLSVVFGALVILLVVLASWP
ncbi:hydrogenase 4 subunit B [Roseiarcus sp.]|uniref:hydrogenase 4 subunit B n=1 Tax=Roseiarcus sp. TaxID=1969460 RepID=UPI003F97B9E3